MNPPEIIYEADSATFIIEKCSNRQESLGFHDDAECGLTPYNKILKVHIITRLAGEPMEAFNDKVSFDVIIGNVCEDDRISLSSLIPDLKYKIKSYDPTFLTESMIINQEIP